jgi:hypothetical protein
MKFFFPSIISLVCIVVNSYGQVIIIRDQSITSPPAPAPSVNPVDLSAGTSVEYLAENEVTLTEGFWAQENANPGSTYFLAALVPPVSYAEMKEKLDGSFCGTNAGALYFKYEEKYNEGLLKYRIYDYQRNEKIPLASQTGTLALTKTLGTNFFTLNLALAGGFIGTSETDSYYILEVENEKGDKYYLRFKYLTAVNH